jgi:hypothetical protein
MSKLPSVDLTLDGCSLNLQPAREMLLGKRERRWMTICPICGSSNRESSPFCESCGNLLSARNPPVINDTSSGIDVHENVVESVAKPKDSSAKLSVLIVVTVFLGVGIAGALLIYKAKRVSQEVRETVGKATNGGSSSIEAPRAGLPAHACQYLSKDAVRAAIGVDIVRTDDSEGTCSFFARGERAEMTSRHLTAMVSDKKADANTQQMMEALSGGLFHSLQSADAGTHQGVHDGTVMVFQYRVDEAAAQVQMKLSEKVMGDLGAATVSLQGIGDEAFDTGKSLMMIRKGDKLIRIMYMTCPCSTDAVKPLARKLVAAL